MRKNQVLFAALPGIFLLLAFANAKPKMPHPDEGEILHFEYTNVDGGKQYLNDLHLAYFPFENRSGHEIIIESVVSKNDHAHSPYYLVSRDFPKRIPAGAHDTLVFSRTAHAHIPEGYFDHAWVINYQGIDQKQYLNIFCEIEYNYGKLEGDTLLLPEANRGDTIFFYAPLTNVGSDPLRVNVHSDWLPNSLVSHDTFPVVIQPGETKLFGFELQTARLLKSYQGAILFFDNGNTSRTGKVFYSGELISTGYPSIKFDSLTLTKHVNQGDNLVFEFWFANDGEAPLLITDARTSCGCLVATYPREPIQTGQRNVIKVRYDSNRVGPINKSITVSTNASEGPIMLRVCGSVKPKPVQDDR